MFISKRPLRLKRRLLLSFFLVIFSAHTSQSVLQAEEGCPLVGITLPELTKVRELSATKDIPCKRLKKAEIQTYLKEALFKQTTPEKLALEKKVLVALRLMPADYDYQEELIALYSDQVGGFYDPELNYFGTASWIPENLQIPVAYHELTHALQDQHFNLDTFTAPSLSSDQLIARSALAEGDATLAMLLISKLRSGDESGLTTKEIESFSKNTTESALSNPNLSKAPKALSAQLIFPYSKGLEYVFKTYKSGAWKTVNEKYQDPPTGSNEILGFKNVKLSEDQKSKLSCDSLKRNINSESKTIYEDTLGALYLGYVLGEDAIKNNIKDRWAGDKLCIIQSENKETLVWGMYLKSEADTVEVSKILSGRLQVKEIAPSSDNFISLTIELKPTKIRLYG